MGNTEQWGHVVQWVPTLLTAGVLFLWLGFRYKPRSCEDWRITYNIIGIILGNLCIASSMLIIIYHFL